MGTRPEKSEKWMSASKGVGWSADRTGGLSKVGTVRALGQSVCWVVWGQADLRTDAGRRFCSTILYCNDRARGNNY